MPVLRFRFFSSWYDFSFSKLLAIINRQSVGSFTFATDIYSLASFIIIMGIWALQVFDASVPIVPHYVPKPGQLPPLTLLNKTLAKKLKVSSSKIGMVK